MSDAPASTDPRDELRRRLAHAVAVFDLMLHPDHQGDLVSFDQREARAGGRGSGATVFRLRNP